MEIIVFSCAKSPYRVGRGPDNDFVFSNPYASRQHFCVYKEYSGVVGRLVVNGKNGVYLNGNRLEYGKSEYIREGDCISLFDKIFVFENAFQSSETAEENRRGEAFITSVWNQSRPDLNTEAIEIEPPPLRKVPEKPSLILAAGPALTMALPIALGLRRSLSILSAVIAALWAATNVIVRKRKLKKEELRRKSFYHDYIEEKREEIINRNASERQYLLSKYPQITEYISDSKMRGQIWKRTKECDDGFMTRIGNDDAKPSYPLNIPRDRFNIVDDSLKSLPFGLYDRYYILEDVPKVIKIRDGSVIGISIGKESNPEEINAFLLQLAVAIPPDRLSIRIVEGKSEDTVWDDFAFISYLPHYRSRYLSDESKKDNVECVIYRKNDGNVLPKVDYEYDCCPENGERIPSALAVAFSKILSGIWDETKGENFKFPDYVGFDSVCKVKDIQYDKSLEKQGRTCSTLEKIRFPIGIGGSGEITFLDIHEKADGPHGLIAGTTGSGKSELITTVILSAAVIYPPDEINFFMIDYKGGGMANMFNALPHVIGKLTNLSASEIRRVKISLRSENQRRQEKFAQYGVNNINEHNKAFIEGRIPEKLPHLIIVVDEFAELKKEQPEFMDSLISVAQIGRSLGIHLILSTQKPSGIVDEKIRSNTKFKIALRMEDKNDSSDVIGMGDAAMLSKCGSGYIKRGGSFAPELFQSAYCMGNMEKKRMALTGVYEDPFLRKCVLNSEETLKEEQEPERSCFDFFLGRICEACKTYEIPGNQPLWLDPLPEYIPYERSAVALADEPSRRRYAEMIYSTQDVGNLLLIGAYGMGESEFLEALVCSAGECNFYICDFAEGRLKEFEGIARCGGVVTLENSENAGLVLRFIYDELKKRRHEQVYRGKNNDRESAKDNNRESAKENNRESVKDNENAGTKDNGGENHERYVDIVFIISNYGEFIRNCQLFSGTGGSKSCAEMMEEIVKYGKNVGIYPVVYTFDISAGEMPSRLAEGFDKTLLFGNNDIYKTSQFLRVPAREVFEIKDVKGRGLMVHNGELAEFQTVSVTKGDIVRTKSEKCMIKALPYPYIPRNPSVETMLERAIIEHPPFAGKIPQKGLPAGYIKESGRLFWLPVNRVKCILINSNSEAKRKSFIENISIILARYGISHSLAQSVFSDDPEKDSKGKSIKRIVLFNNISEVLYEIYKKGVSAKEEQYICNLLDNSTPDADKVTVIATVSDEIKINLAGRKALDALLRKPYGITFKNEILSQRLFDYSYVPYSAQRDNTESNSAYITAYDRTLFYGETVLPQEITEDCG